MTGVQTCALPILFAVPGSVLSGPSKGPFQLLRAGAIPVSCAKDVLEEYRYRYAAKINWTAQREAGGPPEEPRGKKPGAVKTAVAVPVREKRALPEDIEENIREIYEILSEIPIHLDEIAARMQKNPAEVLTALSELEIMGFVSANTGKRFSIC